MGLLPLLIKNQSWQCGAQQQEKYYVQKTLKFNIIELKKELFILITSKFTKQTIMICPGKDNWFTANSFHAVWLSRLKLY